MRRLAAGLATAAGVLLLASPATAQSSAGYSEYYIPVDETSLQIAFTNLDGPTTDDDMHTVITVTAWSPGTTVYYDHWENGYGFDPNNPATADETYVLAATGAAQVFESSNIPTTPRGSATFYDGGDRIFVAGGIVTVTRASWLEARGPGDQASAWEIYPVKPQLTTYVIPFGENLGFTPFLRFYTFIQATEDNTTFTVDLDGDGTPDVLNQNRDTDRTDPGDTATVTLNRGQSFLLDRVSACPTGACSQANGNILAGTTIQGDKTLQVKFVAGNPGQNYCARGFSAFPRGFWTRDYYAPLDQPAGGEDTDYYLHNPHSTAITVNWETRAGTGSLNIPANGTVSYRAAAGQDMPVDSGIYFNASNDFWGVGVGDSLGAAYEWGFSLLPTTLLYQEHFMGWAPGSYPPATGGSADNVGVFLTPAQDNTQVFVDFDNDGVADQTFTLDRLETQYVFDAADGDLSQAHFWATGLFTLSYGENADTAPTSNPSIDLGYVGLPGSDFIQTVLDVDKTASPQVVSTAAGSVATFTIVAQSELYSISSLSVSDVLPASWQFVTDSATITLPDNSTVSGASANPQVSGSTLTWNAGFGGLTGMAPNQTTTIVFQAVTTAVLPAGTLSRNDVTATGLRIFYPGTPQQIIQTFTASDFTFVASGSSQISKTSNATTPAYPDDTFSYTVTLTNPAAAGTNLLTGVSLYDAPPTTEVTPVPGSTTLSHSTVADSFGSQSFALNAGTRNWSAAWSEVDPAGGGAAGGDVFITGGELRLDNSNSNEPTLSRAVDLTGATTARLTFRYRTDTGVDAGDQALVQIGTGGVGGAFVTLQTITGITGASSGLLSFDISGSISATTAIRFTFPNGSYDPPFGTTENLFIDDLSITYDVAVTGPNPPDLISAANLYAFVGGQSITATFDVTVNNPFPTGQTSITNTAATTSVELPIQLTASVTDEVEVPSVLSASVQGRVWQDADGDAAQDLGEPGIANVEVTLKDQFGTPVATAYTDVNGRFLFTGIAPGTGYYVEATAPPDPAGAPLAGLTQSAPAGHSDYRTDAFDLSAGESYTGADQGYRPAAGTAAFGDLAWVDADADGLRDLGEIGLGGVPVRLYRDDGNGVLNTLLDTFVPVPTTTPGTLSVTSGSPTVTGTGTSFLSLGAGDPITIGGVQYTILSVASATSLTLTSNYAGTTAAGLSGTVASAPGAGTVAVTNGSPVVTGTGTTFTSLAQGDPFVINGVRYRVQSVGSDTSLTLTTNYTGATAGGLSYGVPVIETTAPDGSYLFTGVTPVGQTYHVASGLPSGYTRTTVQAFTFPSVAGGTSYLNADFGYNATTPTFSISDRVWNDPDADGVFDGGELGIAGVTIELLDASLNVIGTTITAADGTFSFSGLAGGGADYSTRVSDAGGVLTDFFGTTPFALAGQRLEANLTASIDRTAAPSYGYSVTRSVGDTVYNDVNGNGSQDGLEPGIAGVNVTLYRDVLGDDVISLAGGPGSVTATNGSTAVVGTGGGGGTRFLRYHAGEVISIDGVPYVIASVASNTSLTLTTPYTGPTGGGKTYTANPQSAGTVAVTNGSATITGSGTAFTRYRPGDQITIANGAAGGTALFVYTIQSIASDTSLTLTTTYTGSSNGARAYWGPGDSYVGSVTTDANGQYLFSGLTNQDYVVSVPSLAGYTYVPGTRPDTDGGFPGIQLAATISGTGNVLDRDFGFQAVTQRTISGTIWNDIDADGVIDGPEARLAGVTVDIVDSNNVVILTLSTDASGNYSAVGLAAGTYTVRVTDTLGVLTGYSATFERTEGTTAPFNGQESVNVAGGDVTNVHFGFRRPVPTYANIARFAARSTGSGVLVEWETSSEVGTLGFYLYRLERDASGWTQLNRRMLPGLIDSARGGVYRYLDEDAPAGEALTYVLREVEPTGTLDHGPYRVTPKPERDEVPMAGRFDARPQPIATKALRRQREARTERTAFEVQAQVEAPLRARAAARAGKARAKLAVRTRGLHGLGRDTIATLLGLTPDQVSELIAVRKLRLRHRGGLVAWLPGTDGIEFYGEPIDSLYTLDNVYWLDAKPGRVLADAPGGRPAPTEEPLTFGDTVHFEQDRFAATLVAQDPASDYWPWEYVIAGDASLGTRSFELRVDGATDEPGALHVSLLGATEATAAEDHHVVVSLNGTELGEARWDGLAAFSTSFDVPAGVIRDGANSVEVRGVLDSGAPYSIFYVDSFDLQCRRLYRASGNQLLLRSEERRTLTVSGFDSDQITVVEVTNPRAIRRVANTTVDHAGSFRVSFKSAPGASYLAVAAPALLSPVAWPDTPSSLQQGAGADYLIVAPGPLVEAAQALADYRSGRGLRSLVVDLEDVYDEFNHGIASPEALQAFLAHAWKSWSRRPRYVLLAGNGNVDYRNLLGYGDNLVPPLMAPTPFGLFAADNRFAPANKKGVPRLAIGRLPVLSAAELAAELQKIQAYEGAAPGAWQQHVLMVADDFDPNAGDFAAESESVAGLIPAGYEVTRAYLDAEPAGDVRARLLDALDQGALLVNYVGHGGLDRLAAESLLSSSDVPGLQPSAGPPVLAALTCAVGRFDVPGVTPLASSLVLDPDGGAIAAWAPSGLSFSSEANVLNQGFARALFSGAGEPLGQAVRRALDEYARPGFQPFMLDIYNLLGDPALEVRVP